MIDTVEELGSDAYLYCDVAGVNGFVVARAEGLSRTRVGDQVHLVPDDDSLHVFDSASGARLAGQR